jgi:hypothetical protein
MSKPKISSEENSSELKNKKRKADVSDIVEQQEKRIKKLESSIKSLTSKINKDDSKKKIMHKDMGDIKNTMDEELDFINKKLFQLDKTVTMALNYEEEDPDYIVENDEEYEEYEDGEEEDELSKSYQKSVRLIEQSIIRNNLQNMNPLEYANTVYETKNISDKNKTKELGLIENFIDLTKVKDNKSNLDYFIDLGPRKKQEIINHLKNIHIHQNDLTPMFFKVVQSNIDEYTKKIILQKIETLSSMEVGAGEYHKLNNWIQSLLDIPWNKQATLSVKKNDKPDILFDFLKNAKNSMDKVIYGQNSTKDQIIQIIAKMISNPAKSGNVFAIYGAPGTGKTTIIKEGMSKALGIPFNFISLGGATDSSYLDGHSYTYEGSINGRIVDCLKQSKCMNPIFYFDELDKISSSSKGEEIVNMLIHLTDSSQNTLFQDKYFSGIHFDISKSIFVFSFNDIEKVNKILLDRMELIEVDNFKIEEKKVIVKNYIIPKLFETYNINKEQINFSQEIIDYIVDYKGCHKNEKGIRNVIRRFENIISKLNIILLTGKSSNEIHTSLKNIDISKLPIEINKSIVDDLVLKRGNGNHAPPFGMYS